MTRTTRRFVLAISVVIFLGLSYVAILYAQGYKYSFSENQFLRTGAISLESNTSASVYLDDKLIGQTSFLGNSASINRLLPGNYKLKLQKENYYNWEKTVLVNKGLISDFSRILMVPNAGPDKDQVDKEVENILYPPIKTVQKNTVSSSKQTTPAPEEYYIRSGILYQLVNNKPQKLASNVGAFKLSGDGRKIVWWNNNEIWVIWLEDTNYQPYKKSGDQELITRFSEPINKVDWFRDADHLVADINGTIYIMEIDTRGGLNIVNL